MAEILRTDSNHPDFINLVKSLDEYLAICDGEEHGFYDQFNKLDAIKNVVLLYDDGMPVGCGAFKEYKPGIAEVKRMFVANSSRNKGFASMILNELENWAEECGYTKCILETGLRQNEAIKFYHKNNYIEIDKYPPYEHMENSKCFEKELT